MGLPPAMQTKPGAKPACPPPAPGAEPRSAFFVPDGEISLPAPNVRTLPALLEHGIRASQSGPYLGYRPKADEGSVSGPFVWITYPVAAQRAKDIGRGLLNLGLKSGDCLGICSINRPEWSLCSLAACHFANPIVPLYDTLGPDAIKHIVGLTELKAIACSADKVLSIAKIASSNLPSLKHLVVMDLDSVPIPTEAIEALAARPDISVVRLHEVEAAGKAATAADPIPAVEITPSTLAIICFTSGTTGMPKGAQLSHENVISAAFSLVYMSEHGYFPKLLNTDVHISYLPLAHVFEFVAHALFTFVGASIGFFGGNMLKLLDDLQELRPTIFISVPRIFNRIHKAVQDGLSTRGCFVRALFGLAYRSKLSKLRRGGSNRNAFWDATVFKAIRLKLGGRVRLIFSGSAPIAPEVLDFLRVCFSCAVHEGYGQTENAAGISVTMAGDATAGHVGVPLACCQVCLVDIPEMGYSSKDKPYPRGEICVRGSQVFSGYYKSPEATAAAMRDNGWLATGDVGMWGEGGRLVIVDRVKNMFKLAQGEFISPEVIEGAYLKSGLVQSIFVYGDPLRSQVVGVVFPVLAELARFQKEASAASSTTVVAAGSTAPGDASSASATVSDEVTRLYLAEINKRARATGLKGFEILGAIHITQEDFTLVEENKTPTWKLRRDAVKKSFGHVIDDMYAKLDSQAKK